MNPFIDAIFEPYYRRNPIVLVDVGASGGIERAMLQLKKHLHFIGFEPDDREYKNLAKNANKSLVYLNIGLYKEKTTVDFHLTRKQQVSSIYKPNAEFLKNFNNPERYEVVDVVKVDVDSLDNQLKENNLQNVDIIKLDTQGSELDILKGAEEALSNDAVAVAVEVEFSELYEKQPLFADIDIHLRQFGFQLFDIFPCYLERSAGRNCRRIKGQFVFADALYIKSIPAIERSISSLDNEAKKYKLLRLISICILYNHHDYALEVIEHYKALFSDREIAVARRCIEGNGSWIDRFCALLPRFPGRGKIAELFFIIWKILMPGYWKAIVYLKDSSRLERY